MSIAKTRERHTHGPLEILDFSSTEFLRTRSTLTERLLAVGILKGEETPRRGTPVLACRGRRGVGGWEGRNCGGQGRRRRRKIKKERREKGEEGGVLTRCAARSVWLSLNQEPPIFFHKSPSSQRILLVAGRGGRKKKIKPKKKHEKHQGQ